MLMKRIIRIAAVFVAILCFAAAVTGCRLDDGSAKPDDGTVIATVGDKTLTYGEFAAAFEMYKVMWENYGYNMTGTREDLETFQDSILDMLVGTLAVIHHGEELGILDLNEEQQAELQKKVDDEITYIYDYYTDIAEEEGAEDIDARVEQLIAEEAEYYAAGMTVEEYLDYIEKSVKESYFTEIVKDAMLADFEVTDADVEEWYNKAVEDEKSVYDEDPGAFKDSMEYYEIYGGEPVTYVPEGYSRVMHILVTFGETTDEYEELEKKMEELALEYGRLSLEDMAAGTDGNAARLAEIAAEYNGFADEYAQMQDELFGEAKAKIEAAYAELEGGKAFADVMKEYTEDADFTSYDIFMEKGMLISENESYVDWSDSIKEKFFALSVGEYSEIFRDDDGYHILYYFADEKPGAVAVDSIREAIIESLGNVLRDEEWAAITEAWLDDDSVVIYRELIRQIGTEDLQEEAE